MKKYERPVVVAVEDMAEGVYAASGSICYTFTARITQLPELGNDVYTIQIDGTHNAQDGHHSEERTVAISFNLPVTYYSSNASTCTGSGTNTLVLRYTNETGNYHNNAIDNIGLGQLKVQAAEGLSINSIRCIDCNNTCDDGHSW